MQIHYDGPCHIQNKIEVSRASGTHSDVKNALMGFWSGNLASTYFQYTVFFHKYINTHIYTHTHRHNSSISFTNPSPLKSFIPCSSSDSRKRSLCLESKCIVGVHSNLVSEFHQAVLCVCLQQSTQIVPDPLQTVWIPMWRQYINPYKSCCAPQHPVKTSILFCHSVII